MRKPDPKWVVITTRKGEKSRKDFQNHDKAWLYANSHNGLREHSVLYAAGAMPLRVIELEDEVAELRKQIAELRKELIG